MTRGLQRIAIAAMWLLAVVASARAAVPALHGLAIEESIDGPAVLEGALGTGATPAAPLVAVLVLHASVTPAVLSRLDARVAAYGAKHIPVVVVIGGLPMAETDASAWRDRLKEIVTRERGKVAAYEFGETSGASLPAAPAYAFALKQASIQVRSIDATALVVQGGVPAGAATYHQGAASKPG